MDGALESRMRDLGRRARRAAAELRLLDSARRDQGLRAMADMIERQAPGILAANARDMADGERAGLNSALLDRLRLDDARIARIASGIRQVAELPDPVGEVIREWRRPNGLRIAKLRVPIGVVGIIYESRPNVTSDAAVLCVKTGNGVLLRGGSEAIHSNHALAEALRAGAEAAGLPADCVILVPVTDRDGVRIMAAMDDCIDVIVPRGGHALIEAVVAHARMPVIKHYHGVCHVYVHAAADPAMAGEIVVNAKCQRPGVCNALETLLVDREIAGSFLPACGRRLLDAGVELRGDPESRRILGEETVAPAAEEDWSAEYLDLILSVRVVDGLDDAVRHIEHYGSHHSDAIVTGSRQVAEEFLLRVDSAAVYWNASTRFTDGAEFGFGAEIGISTDKLHARGPMALEELTTYKYLVRGSGQIKS